MPADSQYLELSACGKHRIYQNLNGSVYYTSYLMSETTPTVPVLRRRCLH